MRLCTASEMMAIDRQAIQGYGIPGVVLMENAGRCCCREFTSAFDGLFPGPVVVVAGKGNNGGDGYVMARVLRDLGWQVTTIILAEESAISGDAGVMLNSLRQLAGSVSWVTEVQQLEQHLAALQPQIIIDAIFGTGLKSQVQGLQGEAIRCLNRSSARIFSVDIPSGVDASTGRICGLAVQADMTVTFGYAKIGHASQPGAACAGQLRVVDIGIPCAASDTLTSRVHQIDADVAGALLPQRSTLAHKGTFGHLLVVAGSPGKTGAAALAGNAAVRSGCGLVTVATPATVHDIIEVKLTEAMSCPLPDHQGFLSLAALESLVGLLADRQAVAIGPGLGVTDDLKQLVGRLVSGCERPMVIDADGLNLLCGQLDCIKARPGRQLVLTPHPGEMARLTGLTVAAIQADRFEVTREFSRETGAVVLLKGAGTVIASPDGRVNINSSGNEGLASGGSGDVLTGLVGGLLAQGLDAFAAASLGAWLHGRCAEIVAAGCGTAGMVASDLLPQLPVARQELVKGAHVC